MVQNAVSGFQVSLSLNYVRYSSFIALYPLGGIGEAWTMYNAYGLNEKRVLELPFAAPIVGIHHKKYDSDVDVVVKFIYFPLFVQDFFSYISTC